MGGGQPVTLRAQHVPAGAAVGLLVIAGRQIVMGFAQLSDSVVAGTQQLLDWLEDGPLHLSASTVNDWINDFGATAGNVLTGLVIVVFTLLFFLMGGERIWLFLGRLFPVNVRRVVNGAGRHGWTSLVQYARVQGFVAFIDAVGIGGGAALLGVPLALPIGILVLLGSFVPIVGGVATGTVAVLVALVANGLTTALGMLAVVPLIQQLESNVLQPLIMGKAVSLHPLAVFLVVATRSIPYGIHGALFAVPVMALANTVVRYLMTRQWTVDDEIACEPYYYPWEIPVGDENGRPSRPIHPRAGHGPTGTLPPGPGQGVTTCPGRVTAEMTSGRAASPAWPEHGHPGQADCSVSTTLATGRLVAIPNRRDGSKEMP